MKRISTAVRVVLISALLMTVTQSVTAQLPSDPNLVYVRVAATDPMMGRPVKGLRKEHIKVFEDNIPQEITYFSADNTQLLLGILLDATGPTKDDIKARALPSIMRAGARDDESFIVESGNTPLNDALLQMLDTLVQRGNNRKRALMLITTKRDPNAYSYTKIRDRLKEQSIPLYVLALIDPVSDRGILRDLAELSGGNSYFPALPSELSDVGLKIVTDLKNQYVIGYRSTNRAMDGKWRKLKVIAEVPDNAHRKTKKLNVRAKAGYYAPSK